MALIELSDNIHRLLDEGNYVIGIFIDFTKAFDSVYHEILLHKLYRYASEVMQISILDLT